MTTIKYLYIVTVVGSATRLVSREADGALYPLSPTVLCLHRLVTYYTLKGCGWRGRVGSGSRHSKGDNDDEDSDHDDDEDNDDDRWWEVADLHKDDEDEDDDDDDKDNEDDNCDSDYDDDDSVLSGPPHSRIPTKNSEWACKVRLIAPLKVQQFFENTSH